MTKFELPTLTFTIQSLWRHIDVVGPLLLANIILIGLIIFGFVKSNELTQDENMKLFYTELIFALIGNFVVLLYSGFFIFLAIFGRTSAPIIYRVLYLLVGLLIFLLLNPFSITVLRVALNDKLSEQQKNILSGLTIPLVLFATYLTVNINNGYLIS